jgi:cyclophilin family peptidyl-prolyl cis-trans isomerase
MMRYHLPLALLLAGCPQQPVIPATPSTAAGAAASTSSPASPAVAQAGPGPSSSLGPGPADGSLPDVNAAAGKNIPAGAKIRVSTTQGDFVITLFQETAPKGAAKFKALVDRGVYDGTTFHRVIPGFVAQGGDPLSRTLPAGDPRIGTGTSGDPVPDDFKNGLKHLAGAVAFAHSSAPNSSNSQFYVCFDRLESLDDQYIVFGQVTAGFDAVQRLTPTGKGTPDKILKAATEP